MQHQHSIQHHRITIASSSQSLSSSSSLSLSSRWRKAALSKSHLSLHHHHRAAQSAMTASPSGNALLLKRQLTELRKRESHWYQKQSSSKSAWSTNTRFFCHRSSSAGPVEGFSAGLKDESNLYHWEIMIIGPADTLYEGGFLRAELIFPSVSKVEGGHTYVALVDCHLRVLVR